MAQEIKRHTLSVMAKDVDGLIARIAGMFARRAFTIHSIVSAATEQPEIARITIVADADDHSIEQIEKQLNKLIDVLKVTRLTSDTAVERAILLVKVQADNVNRPQVVDAASIFRARVVDVAPDSVVIEATGSPAKLAALLEVLRAFGIKEMLQSGVVALARGNKAGAPGPAQPRR